MINLIIQTDQSGSNDPINSINNRIFNFTVSEDSFFSYCDFYIKAGSQSTSGVTASIYSGLNASGTVLKSVFISSSNFTQTFASTIFNLNYTLSSGMYSIVLSSLTNSGGNSNYFIKSGNLQTINTDTGIVQTYDSNGTVLPTPTPTPTRPFNKKNVKKIYVRNQVTIASRKLLKTWSISNRFR